MNVRGEIAVAEIEPIDAAEGRQALQRMKRLPTVAPTFCLIHNSRKRVSDNVEVRRDSQTMQGDVIAGVHNHRQVARVNYVVQTKQEFGSPYAAGQRGDGLILCRGHEDMQPLRRKTVGVGQMMGALTNASREKVSALHEFRIQRKALA